MKQIFTTSFALLLAASTQAQVILQEDFNYPAGQLTATDGGANVSGGNWTAAGSNSSAPIQVLPDNLSYSGYLTTPSPTSGKIALSNPSSGLEDISRLFPSSVSSGSVYTAMVFSYTGNGTQLPGNGSNGTYFTGFSPSSATNYICRVYIRQGTAVETVNFGVSYGSGAITWTGDFSTTTNHLLVFGYEFVTGTSNDLVKLWVNPSNTGIEPAPLVSAVSSGTDASSINRIFFRQDNATTPVSEIDAITVATNWTSLLNTTLSVDMLSFTAQVGHDQVKLQWVTSNEDDVQSFVVERSNNAQNYVEVGEVTAYNSKEGASYDFTEPLRAGVQYYRLRILSKDGSYSFSNVIVVTGRKAGELSISLNTARQLQVIHPEAASGAVLEVYAMDGKKVVDFPVKAGSSDSVLDLGQLVEGLYIVVYRDASGIFSQLFQKL